MRRRRPRLWVIDYVNYAESLLTKIEVVLHTYLTYELLSINLL